MNWISAVVAHRRHIATLPESEQWKIRSEAMAQAIAKMAQNGTGWVFDIASSFQKNHYPKTNASLGIIPFAELISINDQRATETWSALESLSLLYQKQNSQSPNEHELAHGLVQGYGLSPHATYTIDQRMLEKAVEFSKSNQVPLAMHVAESRDELEWLYHGSGPFDRALASYRDNGFSSHRLSSVESVITLLGQSHRSLLIHGNYLTSLQIQQIAEVRDVLAVVYCPRTHAAFQHAPYPLEKLLEERVAVFLGTDSLASNPDLDVWNEAKFLKRLFPQLPGRVIWEMITTGPRRFLELTQQDVGLGIGGPARFAKIDLPANDAFDQQNLLDKLLLSDQVASCYEWKA